MQEQRQPRPAMRLGSTASEDPQTRAFLLWDPRDGTRRSHDEHRTEWRIRKGYLEEWPGKVALVIGGSNDMRSVRTSNERALWDAGIKTKVLHSRTQRDLNHLPNRCLLLCTEAIFAPSRERLRTSLDLIFDVCEVHRIVQSREDGCGWSDVLETFRITRKERRRRRAMLHSKYLPAFEEEDLPEAIPEPLTVKEKQERVPYPLSCYVGRRFPSIEGAGSDLRKSLVRLLVDGQVPDFALWVVQSRRESRNELSFNQLPICHLLEVQETQQNLSNSATCLVGACVLQLMSSKDLELLFRDRTMIDECEGDMSWLWSLSEAPKFLQVFLTSTGKHDVACTLFVMLVQWVSDLEVPCDRRHEALRNLQGQQFPEFAELVLPPALGERVAWLLSQLMKLAEGILREALRTGPGITLQDVASLDAPAMLPFLRSQFCLAAMVQSKEEPFYQLTWRHQLAWRHMLCGSSCLQVCADQNIRVDLTPKGLDHVHPFGPGSLLKNVISHYLPVMAVDDTVTFETSGDSPRAAAVVSKLVAAVSISLVLQELAGHLKKGEADEQYDGIPATDEDGSSTCGLRLGVLEQLAEAAEGRAGAQAVPSPELEDQPVSHVVRLPCTPPCFINPYVRKEVVVLALNRFMTPVLLSVTAPVLLLDGELSSIGMASQRSGSSDEVDNGTSSPAADERA